VAACRWATLLALVHLLLALTLAWITPYRTPDWVGERRLPDIGAPDEDAHVQYVEHSLAGRGIPSLSNLDSLPTYEAHQPPTHYALAAAWARIGGFGPELKVREAGLWLRAFDALIGAVGVLGAFAAGWWGYRNRAVALGAATFVALLPMNAALSGAFSNDPPLIALGSWTLAFSLRGLRDGWTPSLAIATGLALGLGLAIKTSGIASMAPVIAAMAVCRARPSRWWTTLALALALPAPIWVRNALLYQDPWLMRTFERLSAADALDPATFSSVGSTLRWLIVTTQDTARSFFGMFGYAAAELPWPLVASGVLGLGTLVLSFLRDRRARKEPETLQSDLVALCFLGAVALLDARWNLGHFQPQARYLFPALSALALVFARGAEAKLGQRAPIALAIGLLTMDAATLVLLPDAFTQMQAGPS
jgi:4-amino-4-deoxy-L-arabinose transferase-like glycosyltransferase